MMLRAYFLSTLFVATGIPAAAQSGDSEARGVVRAAERAVSDDSADVVRERWSRALGRDSTDRAAALGLGSLSRLTYDFPAAERYFASVLGRGGPPDQWSVQARLGLYRVALATGDNSRSDSLVTIALKEARSIGDRGSEMDAWIGLSNTRGVVGGQDVGLAALDTLSMLLPPGDSWERAEYLCRLGLFRGIKGDSAAGSLISRGVSTAERVGERRLTGHCLEARALVFSLQGTSDSVLPIMRRAEALLTQTHDHSSLARLHSRLSDELQARGRLGEARVALGRVLGEAAISKNRHRVASATAGLGMLALRLGDLPTAAQNFEEAARISDSLGQAESAMIARENRGEVMAASGDLQGAREAFLGTLKESEENQYYEDALFARQHLAGIAIRQGDYEEAERQLAAADASARERGLDDSRKTLAYDRGRLALARGDLARAEKILSGYLANVDPQDRLLRYTIRVRIAEALARGGKLDRAEREITAAGEELESWRASLGEDDLRRFAFSATALGEYDTQGPVARVLAALAEGGRVDVAFAQAEQRRARALADRLNQAEGLREEAALGQAHRVRPVTAAEVGATLPDDGTALLEFVAGAEGAPTTLFVVTKTGARAHLLPSADSLAGPIRRLVAMVENGGDPSALARTLGSTLLAPATESIPEPVTRLVIVPDGPLHRVPFDVLRLSDGQMAVERWSVALAPSAAVAARLWGERARPPGNEPVRLLAMGDPAFPGERASASLREAQVYRSAFAAEGGLARLAGSGREAREVARYAPGAAELRLRGEASEEWLKRTPLDGFRVIHLATHALVDETSLARTALALAPGGGEDGFLSPADLAGLRLDADLVVLSGCRTAGGVAIAGEGMEGLTAPLFAAGARSIVATQWRIGDESTVRLVDDFYDGVAGGLTVADALRKAKLSAIARGAPAAEWAGFTVVGDPVARPVLAAPSRRRPALWLAAAGAAALALLAVYFRRRGRSSERRDAGDTSAVTHH
jgi:CHAT domain-containing protein/tetratricopeptide (TPR) repeat protein